MPRTTRTPAFLVALLVATLTLAGCGGDDTAFESTTSDPDTTSTSTPDSGSDAEPKADNESKSCQAIVGSGAVEDIQAVFDKYKDNNTPLTTADAKKMRDALDALAKAGDNASPQIREDVVQLVADAGSLIDSRAGLPGVGRVATPEEIQRQIDALCR